MVTVEDAVIAKIEKGGTHFEVLVDPAIAYDLKEGMAVSLGRMLAVNAVFTDSKKGLRASDKHLQEMFKTDDIEKIARDIVVNGDVQITTEFRRKKIEERKRQIAEFISRNAHNPQTGTPHPPDRIISALEKTHVSIDPFKPASQQVEAVMSAIKGMLPISIEKIKLKIHVPSQHSARAYGVLKNFGSGEFLQNGSLTIAISIPAGLKDSIYHRLSGMDAKIDEVRQ